MQEKGLRPNEISYSTLINKAPYEKGIELFGEMLKLDIKPGMITLKTIEKKLLDPDDLFRLLGLIQTYKAVETSKISYISNNFIKAIDTYTEAKALINLIEHKAYPFVDIVSFNILLNKTETYKQSLEVLKMIEAKKLKKDSIMFNTLLEKAVAFCQPVEEIFSILEQMMALKLKPQSVAIRKKGGQIIKPYTVLAVQESANTHQDEFKAWIMRKKIELFREPRWLQAAWNEFFEQLKL